MKTIYLNCENGVSGDMVLNALADLTDDPAAIKAEIDDICREIDSIDQHMHDHGHSHEHTGHFHRSYAEVVRIIESISVNDSMRIIAKQIYEVIAKAESAVHGDSLDTLHFHEVGRNQAIANVVGVAVCLDALQADKIIVSEICDGHGTVQCAHGLLEVPVPAVKAMLEDCELAYRQTDYEGEMVTPSGLAMLIGIGSQTGAIPEGSPVRSSEAFGGRRTGEHGLVAALYLN